MVSIQKTWSKWYLASKFTRKYVEEFLYVFWVQTEDSTTELNTNWGLRTPCNRASCRLCYDSNWLTWYYRAMPTDVCMRLSTYDSILPCTLVRLLSNRQVQVLFIVLHFSKARWRYVLVFPNSSIPQKKNACVTLADWPWALGSGVSRQLPLL